MAVGDVYELVDKQRMDGQEIRNVYHYRHDAGAADALNLAEAFANSIIPMITPLQTQQLQHYAVQVVNLDNDSDFAETAIAINGNTSETGPDLPTFVASRLRVMRTSRTIRNGAKRYAGVTGGMVDGRVLVPNILLVLTDLAAELTEPLDAVPDGTFTYVLYGKVTPNRPSPIVVDVDDVIPLPAVTTQSTRKAWVGQ